MASGRDKIPRPETVRVSVYEALLKDASEYPAFKRGRFINDSEMTRCLMRRALDDMDEEKESFFFKVENVQGDRTFTPWLKMQVRYSRKVPKETVEECNRILEEAKEAISIKLKVNVGCN